MERRLWSDVRRVMDEGLIKERRYIDPSV